jgi:peroxiredoxin
VSAALQSATPAAPPRPAHADARPFLAGKIGATFLCIYLLGVAVRIDGCYQPTTALRDDTPGAGPSVGTPFPGFSLTDVGGAKIALDDLRGSPAVVAFVPSLDWSPPSKARIIDLADAFAGRRDVRVAIVMTAVQATPRALAFVRDRRTPFYYLVDDGDLTERLGLTIAAPDQTAAARAATFVLDANGTVMLRDIRNDARTWPAAAVIAAAAVGGSAPSAAPEHAP